MTIARMNGSWALPGALASHPSTLNSVSNLSKLLFTEMGYLERSEPLMRRALVGQEKALGARHPQTQNSAVGLCMNLEAQGGDCAAEVAALEARHGI